MAIYDWNHNGKKDIQDDYLEYNIYKKSTEDNGGYTTDNSGCGFFFWLVAILILLGLLSQCGGR